MGKLINRIPGSGLLISSLPGSALRTLVESLGKPRDVSDFIWDFGKLPFPTHLGKYFIKIVKIRAKIHEIWKIKAIFGLGMTPIYGLKNGQIKSLDVNNCSQNLAW